MPRHNPWTVKVELARGCTMRCPFCSLPEMEWAEGPWVFMQEALFRALIDELAAWLPKVRIEFEGRGEPSFHPRLKEFITYARSAFPRCQLLMTTNGDTVRRYREGYRDWIYSLLEAGLNIALLDCYSPERYEDYCTRFPEAKRFFEDKVHPYGYRGPSFKQVILMNAVPGNENIIRQYHNQGGTANAQKAAAAGFEILMAPEPLQKMCVRPFRELTVWSGGEIPVCCNDWLPANVIGRFPQMSLREAWDRMDPARELLLQKNRGGLRPCNVCTERPGFRVGLEMDWFGKDGQRSF